jgi:hypothetical protein
MKKMLNEGNQIHNFISSSGSGTVINYGSDCIISYGSSSGSGSTSQKVTVPTVSVPVPQGWEQRNLVKNLPLNLRPQASRLEVRRHFFSQRVIGIRSLQV